MAPSYTEPRLRPLTAPFLDCKELLFACRDEAEVAALNRTWALQRYIPSRLRRRHSIGSYVPHGLAVLDSPKFRGCRRAAADVTAVGSSAEPRLAGRAAARLRWGEEEEDEEEEEWEEEPAAAAVPALRAAGGLSRQVSSEASAEEGASPEVWPSTDDEFEVCESHGETPACHDAFERAGQGSMPLVGPDEASPYGCLASFPSAGCREPQSPSGGCFQEVTTLMIRNLPPFLTQQELLRELDRSGFAGLYDFVYMPSSFEAREGKGYAFVNLVSAPAASALIGAWHGSRRFAGLVGSGSEGTPGAQILPALNLSPAIVQGLDANMRKWARMSRVRDPNFRPFTRGGTVSGCYAECSPMCSPMSQSCASEAGLGAFSGRFGGAGMGSESPAVSAAHPSPAVSPTHFREGSRAYACLSQAALSPAARELEEGVTTVMVRNLPKDLLQQAFLEELDNAGFADLYDFVYMPCSFEARESKGYAFVNFATPLAAAAFMGSWQRSRRLAPDGTAPPLNISAAAVQGLEANAQKWAGPRMSRIRNPALRPFVRGGGGAGAGAGGHQQLLSPGAGPGLSPAASPQQGLWKQRPRQPWQRTVAAGLPVPAHGGALAGGSGGHLLALPGQPLPPRGLTLERRSCGSAFDGAVLEM